MKKFSENLNQHELQPTESYGESIRSRRRERGITLTELSEKTSVSRQQITNVELGLDDLTEPQKTSIDDFIRKQRII